MSEVALKVTAICWLALNMFGCSSITESTSSKTNAQIWEKTIRQADVLRDTQKAFEKTHQFEGKTAQVAMNRLGEEGFSCSLEYKMLPTLEKGSVDHFVSENVPMIYCSKPHVQQGADDVCRVFWAAFEIDWQDPARRPEALKQEFGISAIKKEMYFCRVSEAEK
jgi:hypothetical protein